MKKISFLIFLPIALYSLGQAVKKNKDIIADQKVTYIPASLLTGEQTYWSTATLSSLDYVNAASGYNDDRNAGGMVVKFKFTEGNRFKFLLYVQANCYGTETETWTEVEGQVEFTKDDKGQNIFTTTAEKGVSRAIKDGRTAVRTIRENELKSQYSNTYLWERIDFPDDPSNTYLLTVNLDEHPQADINVPGSIHRSWVTKFYIPVKKQIKP